MVPYKINLSGNRVFISIEGVAGASSQPVSRDPINNITYQQSSDSAQLPSDRFQPVQARQTVVATPQNPTLMDVDFRRNDDGGWIVFDMSDPETIVSLNRGSQRSSIEVLFRDLALPRALDRRLDVSDFATPVSSVDTFRQGNDVKAVISIREEMLFEFFSNRSGGQYIVKVNERVEIEEEERLSSPEAVYTGQRVNFNFQDIQVRAALNLLLSPEVSGEVFNVVISDAITPSDRMTLKLQNVPWDQALDIILESEGLGKRQPADNIMIIDTQKNLDDREKEELAAQQEIKQLEPLRTIYIQINYSKASDLATLLQRNTGERQRSFLSDRGSVSIDERTNTLILLDTDTKLEEIRALIEALDTPVRQVLIEARVVIATDDFTRDLGVRFGYSLNQDLGDGHGAVFGGRLAGNTQFSGDTAFSSNNSTPQFPGGAGDGGTASGENFLVSLPIASPTAAAGLAIGKIGSYLLQLELAASQTEGTSEVLSTPRVITANQKQASVLQGREIPYQTVSQSGTQTEFREAVLKLDVTPQITPDDRIIMDLVVTSDDVSDILNDGQIVIDRREVSTQVLVDNGETVVLGGVFQRTRNNTMSRVPFLSDIPYVGNLFRSTSAQDSKRELLIFVTPKIVRENS